MPQHLDTPKKSKILGAKEFLEHLKETADEDGKVNLRKLRGGGPAIAACFGTSKQNVSNIVTKGRERRTLEQETRGGFRGDDAKATAATKTATKKAGVNNKVPAGQTGLGLKGVRSTMRRCSIWPKASLSEVQEKTALESDWTRQYDQGISVLDERMSGMGCGRYIFGTKDNLRFTSPYSGGMRIEISDGFSPGKPVGSDGSGGSLRMSGPEFWYGTIGKIGGVEHGSPLQFLIPFRHIEAIIVRTIHTKATKQRPSEPKHTVTIIPTGAAGVSSIKRELPQIIEFEMPVRAKDEGLSGRIGAAEQPDAGNETYLAAFITACKRQLKLFDKQVVEVDVEQAEKDNLAFPMRWERDEHSTLGNKGEDKGMLFFLPGGAFFASETRKADGTPKHIYIPLEPGAQLASSIWLVVHKTLRDEMLARMDIWFSGMTDSAYWTEKDRVAADSAPKRPRKVAAATATELRSGEVELCSDADPDNNNIIVLTGLRFDMLDKLSKYIQERYVTPDGEGKPGKENTSPQPETARGKKRRRDEDGRGGQPREVKFDVKSMLWSDKEYTELVTMGKHEG
ncbi:hypothetical protein LTR97_009649 [Elasticomyces elasticus]|uniref:Histone chaperone RTT106/FACT complex subunit SPT16-like middle domain-containing protein n=1 Tax=Elasticomyces elasticus TaxID=574655 RepID=A0AAN7ZX25_9PEZI|nr:hypothetical protein LTR97_009649 [Elasticomyces elasticus]